MQGSMARAARAYQQTQVQSQSPVELVVMLYDALLRWLNTAADAIDRKDMVAKRDGISRSLAILAELQSTLNLKEGGEIAASLDRLYTYATGQLVDANLNVSSRPVREVIRTVTPLRDAWSQISRPGGAQNAQAGGQK